MSLHIWAWRNPIRWPISMKTLGCCIGKQWRLKLTNNHVGGEVEPTSTTSSVSISATAAMSLVVGSRSSTSTVTWNFSKFSSFSPPFWIFNNLKTLRRMVSYFCTNWTKKRRFFVGTCHDSNNINMFVSSSSYQIVRSSRTTMKYALSTEERGFILFLWEIIVRQIELSNSKRNFLMVAYWFSHLSARYSFTSTICFRGIIAQFFP